MLVRSWLQSRLHSLRRSERNRVSTTSYLRSRIRSDRVALSKSFRRRAGWVGFSELDVAAAQHTRGQHVSIGEQNPKPVVGVSAVPQISPECCRLRIRTLCQDDEGKVCHYPATQSRHPKPGRC